MKLLQCELGQEVDPGFGNSDRSLVPWLAAGLAASVGAAAYIRSRDKKPGFEDASLLPYCDDIAECLDGYEYAVVGGLPIDAFNDESSVIDPTTRSITVSEDFDAKLLRQNGSIRDYDIFVLGKTGGEFQTVPQETIDHLKSTISKRVAGRAEQEGHPSPVISVFSFDEDAGLFHTATILNGDGGLKLAHGDSEEELPEDALQTWSLNFPNTRSIKILNPWEQYWRSVVRFASGPKDKDLKKLMDDLAKLRATPGLAEQEDSELCQAYKKHYQAMLRGNSRNALNAEWNATDREWARVTNVGALVLARRLLTVGQRSERITQLVQSLPNVFDRFVGVK